MKYFTLVFASVLSISSWAHADWVIEQKTSMAGQEQLSTMWIKDSMLRMDQGKEMTMIADGDEGNMTMLMHGQKMVMKLDAEKLKSMLAMAAAATGGGGEGVAAKPVATGQKEKVGDYDCEIYTWSGKMGAGKFWVAKDFKGYEAINAAGDKLMQAMGSPMAALAPKSGDFPGMVVKSEMQMMGQTAVTELVSAKEETVEAAVFAVPADYKEMSMPALPGAK